MRNWVRITLIAFVIYFVVGLAVNLLLNYAIQQGWSWRVTSAPFLTIISILYAPVIVAFGGGGILAFIYYIVSVLAEVALVSLLPILYLAKNSVGLTSRKIIILTLVLAVFPLFAKIIGPPLLAYYPYDHSSDAATKTYESRYIDIPISIISDRLVARELQPSDTDKHLEITVRIDSPVNATKVGLECELFQGSENDQFRFISSNSSGYFYFEDGSYPNPREIEINPGVNDIKQLIPIANTASQLSPETKVYTYDFLKDAFLSKDGPYYVECQLDTFYVGGQLYRTDSSKPTETLKPINSELLVNSKVPAHWPWNSTDGYFENTVIKATQPYKLTDFTN